MQPEIHIGPLTLQTFGLMFALGFIAAGMLIAQRLKELDKPVDWAYELIFAALVGGIVGSRLDFIIQNYDEVSDDLLGNLFSGAGLVWYGGAIGGAIGVVLWARWRKMLNLGLLDLCAPGWRLATRSGGSAASSPATATTGSHGTGRGRWPIPEGTVATDVPVHPTPIYETLAMGLVAYTLWRLRDVSSPACCSPSTWSSPGSSGS